MAILSSLNIKSELEPYKEILDHMCVWGDFKGVCTYAHFVDLGNDKSLQFGLTYKGNKTGISVDVNDLGNIHKIPLGYTFEVNYVGSGRKQFYIGYDISKVGYSFVQPVKRASDLVMLVKDMKPIPEVSLPRMREHMFSLLILALEDSPTLNEFKKNLGKYIDLTYVENIKAKWTL